MRVYADSRHELSIFASGRSVGGVEVRHHGQIFLRIMKTFLRACTSSLTSFQESLRFGYALIIIICSWLSRRHKSFIQHGGRREPLGYLEMSFNRTVKFLF